MPNVTVPGRSGRLREALQQAPTASQAVDSRGTATGLVQDRFVWRIPGQSRCDNFRMSLTDNGRFRRSIHRGHQAPTACTSGRPQSPTSLNCFGESGVQLLSRKMCSSPGASARCPYGAHPHSSNAKQRDAGTAGRVTADSRRPDPGGRYQTSIRTLRTLLPLKSSCDV
jgi:hypothetical protein